MEKRKCRLMHATAVVAVVLGLLAGLLSPAPVRGDAAPRGVSYMNFEQWGRVWSDAEKSPETSEDDLLCWAAAASNVLHYTGWGLVADMSTADQMFLYFANHWTNVGSLMDCGWEWWFGGVNSMQGQAGWSQVHTPGGGFYPELNFWDYYYEQWSSAEAMAAVDQFLRLGCGVGLALYGGGGHAVTCWGYNYDADSPGDYYGIWITDSDDDRHLTNPPDRLRYYDVAYSATTGRWHIQNFYGSNNWYIGGVEGLALIPEPGSICVLVVGCVGLVFRWRHHK
jgi:hypothetical protein